MAKDGRRDGGNGSVRSIICETVGAGTEGLDTGFKGSVIPEIDKGISGESRCPLGSGSGLREPVSESGENPENTLDGTEGGSQA